MNKNILKGTKTYLVGSIQYACGRKWREEISAFLEKELGIICLDPYKGQMIGDEPEGEELHKYFKHLIKKEEFDLLSKEMRKIRCRDLKFTDIADYIIGYINTENYTCGTWEEIFWANRQKKQIFLVVEGGKKKMPLWLFGTIPHEYVYSSFDSLKNDLLKINSGQIKIQDTRLQLLKEEYR